MALVHIKLYNRSIFEN